MKRFTAILLLVIMSLSLLTSCSRDKDDTAPNISYEIQDNLESGGGRKATVILLGGQSNASGCSIDQYLRENVDEEEYAEYEAGYDNVYINYYVTDRNVSNGFVKCRKEQGELGGYFGPELGLAQGLHEAYPDRTFFIIKCAWGGTNLCEQWLSPSSKGDTGILYANFVKFVNDSLEYLVSKDYDVTVEAMCWMQGESDAVDKKNAGAYEKNLRNFIADIRSEFAAYAPADGIAFVDAYISNNSTYWVNFRIVNEAKLAVSNDSQMNALIDTIAYALPWWNEPRENPDLAHYDSLGQLTLGNLFALEVIKYLD